MAHPFARHEQVEVGSGSAQPEIDVTDLGHLQLETVDEAIYEKEDWERLIGIDRNRYFVWDPPRQPLEQPDPPRSAIPQAARRPTCSRAWIPR